ncbi:hypothetical protein VTH06DRAFT_5641 [Thermothelomyces fergusii]
MLLHMQCSICVWCMGRYRTTARHTRLLGKDKLGFSATRCLFRTLSNCISVQPPNVVSCSRTAMKHYPGRATNADPAIPLPPRCPAPPKRHSCMITLSDGPPRPSGLGPPSLALANASFHFA